MPPNRSDDATALETDGKGRANSIRSRKYIPEQHEVHVKKFCKGRKIVPAEPGDTEGG